MLEASKIIRSQERLARRVKDTSYDIAFSRYSYLKYLSRRINEKVISEEDIQMKKTLIRKGHQLNLMLDRYSKIMNDYAEAEASESFNQNGNNP